MPTTSTTPTLIQLRASVKRAMFLNGRTFDEALCVVVNQVEGRDLSTLILEANEEIHPASTKQGFGRWFPTTLDQLLRDTLKGVLRYQLQMEAWEL